MKSVDLSGRKVVSARDVEAAVGGGATEIVVAPRAILTPTARDVLRKHGCELRVSGAATAVPVSGGSAYGGGAPAAMPAASPEAARLFASPEAEAIKAEIVSVGRKLWQRMYVDGNGGNISYRIGENAVICTPTLVSKADLQPSDLCLVDLEGRQLAGTKPRTSEILMHLEIYKSVPQAKAVVHCHPPHATAYAITGRIPPNCVIPEYEVFVGNVALAPYQTPGTQAFADAVLPHVRTHNTVLLANHGIVCWADTVTHAEWYAEVVDTYCWTLMLASQLGAPITHIPQEKAADLLAIKKKLGLPDSRLAGSGVRECELCDMPELPGAIAVQPHSCGTSGAGGREDAEAIVQAVTDAVMAALRS
jgi:L-fuculose-phosphate aldolase